MVTTRQGRAGSERPSGPSHDDNPAVVYRDSLSRGSYWAVHHALVTVAELLDGKGTDPWTFPWWELAYRHTARVRRDRPQEAAAAGRAQRHHSPRLPPRYGVDVFTVQQLAEHADAVTTARYDRRGEEARRSAAGHLCLPETS
jgi:hypothetical protein